MKNFTVKKSHGNPILMKWIEANRVDYDKLPSDITMNAKEMVVHITNLGLNNSPVKEDDIWSRHGGGGHYYTGVDTDQLYIRSSNNRLVIDWESNKIVNIRINKRINGYDSIELPLVQEFIDEVLRINDEIGRMKTAVEFRKQKKKKLLDIKLKSYIERIVHSKAPDAEVELGYGTVYLYGKNRHTSIWFSRADDSGKELLADDEALKSFIDEIAPVLNIKKSNKLRPDHMTIAIQHDGS